MKTNWRFRWVLPGLVLTSEHPDLLLKRILLLLSITSGYAMHSYGAEPYESGKPLTLARALALTLERSPELSAFSWDLRAAEARTLQAGLHPNPEISLESEDIGGTRTGVAKAQTTLLLSQLIELGGKHKARTREANKSRDVLDWDYQSKRLDVLKTATQAFVDVLVAQRRVELAREILGLAEQVLPLTQKRVEAGKASAVEQTRADAAVASARIDLELAQRTLLSARQNLAAQWGSTVARFAKAAGDLEETTAPPSFDALTRGA